MMKKTLSILAIVFLSIIIAPSVFASGVPPTNSLLSGPPNCVKINSTFTVKLPVGNAKNAITFHSGIVVAADNAIVCPSKTSAITSPSCKNGDKDINDVDCYLLPEQSSQMGIIGMMNVIYSVTNWVFFLLTILAVLMIIYGGFIYITAAGDPAKATKAKGILTFAVIGLAIALLAKFIPSLVRFILGV